MNNEVTIRLVRGREIPATTSLRVAEVFGKEHKNVLRDIKEVVSKCSESFNALNFEPVTYADAKGECRPMYVLSKDGFIMLVMGYIGEKAMALKEAYIAQFNLMEEKLRGGLPNFADPVAAAEAWIERYKSEQAALAENRRLALENAEQAKTITKQADTIDDLEVALGDNRDWKAVTAIPWLKDYFISVDTHVLSRVGKVLARMSRQAAVEIRKAPDKRWNTVNVYHVTVVARFHKMLEDEPALLADIRK